MVLAIGSVRARFVATDHGPPTLAVGLDCDGATLAYSADSGPGWSVEELGSSIGTFLCEATYTHESEGSLQHLSGGEAGTMARSAGVGSADPDAPVAYGVGRRSASRGGDGLRPAGGPGQRGGRLRLVRCAPFCRRRKECDA